MEPRLAHVESIEIARPMRARADRNVCAPRFLFVTYAVEIEGEAPLIAAEAVDD